MNVLWIGNSYTQRNDLPGLLAEMAGSLPSPVVIEHERVIANGASLRRHLNAGAAMDAIASRAWDFVVLQEQSTLPLKSPARFHQSVRDFHLAIQAVNSRAVLFQTWARQDAAGSQDALSHAARAIADELGCIVAPVGQAWRIAIESGLELHDKDGSHPSLAGSYLAACVFLGVLAGQSPVGLPAPVQLAGLDIGALQRAGWAAST